MDASDLPVVTSLAEARKLPAAALATALARILRDLDSGTEPVAGFQSAI